MRLSVVIVSWNTRDLLRDCLNSLYETIKENNFEVIVVDNHSGDNSDEMVKREFPSVRLIVNAENTGYAAANNQGMRNARGEFILCLNPDTVVFPGTADRVIEFLETHPDHGAAGCRLRLPDGSYQTAVAQLFRPLDKFVIYGFFKYLHKAGLIKAVPYERVKYSDDYLRADGTVDYMIGAFMMIRRGLIEKIGGLDPRFFFCVDDLDLGLRVNKAGFKMKHLMDCEILHVANQSGKLVDRSSTEFRGTAYYWAKHYGGIGKLAFDYLRISLILREHTVRILQKMRLDVFRHLIFAIYMALCIPVEALLIIPLEIRHRSLIREFPSYRSLKTFEASIHKQAP